MPKRHRANSESSWFVPALAFNFLHNFIQCKAADNKSLIFVTKTTSFVFRQLMSAKAEEICALTEGVRTHLMVSGACVTRDMYWDETTSVLVSKESISLAGIDTLEA